MDNLRASILRAELALLDARIARWNALYAAIEAGLAGARGIRTVPLPAAEAQVGMELEGRADMRLGRRQRYRPDAPRARGLRADRADYRGGGGGCDGGLRPDPATRCRA
ncbi:MAG: hypothetical protein AAFW46_19290, partial [Pseudomonadota bacterium]